MRFIPIANAKVKAGEEVFVQDATGKQGLGTLSSKKETAEGTTFEFELPQYFNPSMPAFSPVLVTNITHVCKIAKAKTEEDAV